MNILGISGSLRTGSLNTRLLACAGSIANDHGASVTRFDIGAIPLYNSDLEADGIPEPVADLKAAIDEADAVLLATPEYNYGVPGVLKNALDWASRPAFKSPLAHKPIGIVSASMSTIGGARAQAQLRNVLFGTLSEVYPAPEFLLASAHAAFTDDGALVDEKTRQVLERYVSGFVAWVAARSTD